MVTYEYTGESERVFPTVSITVNKGDQFDAPAGLVFADLKVVSEKKSAPAVSATVKEIPNPDTKTTSAPSDINAGA